MAALLAARSLGVPVASSFHTNFDHYLTHYGLGVLSCSCSATCAGSTTARPVTLVPSEATRRRLLADGVQRVEIWSRGVDGQAFHPRHRDPALRRSLGLRAGRPAAALRGPAGAGEKPARPAGGLRPAAATAAVAASERCGWPLVGDGPLVGDACVLRSRRRCSGRRQHGADLSRWYASADVFAFPSLSETFGNVILEAQASGLPVVGFDCQAVRQRVTANRDGLLMPTGTEMTDALEALCRRGDMRNTVWQLRPAQSGSPSMGTNLRRP